MGGGRSGRRLARRSWTAGQLAAVALVLTSAVVGAVSFRVTQSTEHAGGLESSTQFLQYWAETGSEAGTVPARLPAQLSTTVATPTRLPAGSRAFLVNAGARTDQAMVWVFTESAGMPVNTEVELQFVLHFSYGTAATSLSETVYLETRAVAIVGTNVYTLYVDAGHVTGVTFTTQIEISQECAGVGSCP